MCLATIARVDTIAITTRSKRVAHTWALSVVLLLSACGGGVDGRPAQFPKQTISGAVVRDGIALVNAQVYIMCTDGAGAGRYYTTTTDDHGGFQKSVDTATAPCVLSVNYGDNYKALFSYARTLVTGTTTVNITPVTDATLALTVGVSALSSTLDGGSASLENLRALLARGNDVTSWSVLREQLKSSVSVAVSDDIEAMHGDPVSAPLDTFDVSDQPGYYRLLKKLALNGIDSKALQAMARARMEEVAGTNGAELRVILSGLVWQRCVVGMTWNGSNCVGTPALLLWTEIPTALALTATPGTAWRLPTKDELASLLVQKSSGNLVDPVWFPNSPAYWTWTSDAPCINANEMPLLAYAVNMQDGDIGCGEDFDQLHVRLVR